MSDIPQLLDGCGLVVRPSDEAGLAGAIAHLLDHPEEARRLGAEARQKIIDRYSWRVGAADLGAYFQGLAKRSPVPEAVW
jgi:glycosyltransferase involved in cell wall biosynthesis